ncbi:uncharacterized protein PSFLO_07213 [Pseudozyma flocculosa]|uniref:Secreted protein n=1 Tax=Pseudozyma flocculosa TaxID=84751 RepID=A0A5C3FE29_9BASI|nr:uncharacterized protein PSFLO_07213 [Pseudozyma flocculosa]
MRPSSNVLMMLSFVLLACTSSVQGWKFLDDDGSHCTTPDRDAGPPNPSWFGNRCSRGKLPGEYTCPGLSRDANKCACTMSGVDSRFSIPDLGDTCAQVHAH